MRLRPYQERLVSDVLADIRSRTSEIVLAAAPGAGKTEMAFAIIRRAISERFTARVLVLTHGTTFLRTQFTDRAIREFGATAVHAVVGPSAVPEESQVIVALPQSLYRRGVLPACDVVVVDEAHEFYDAKMAKQVIRAVGAASVVLLTGSPSSFVARGSRIHFAAMFDIMKECPDAYCNPAVDLVASDFLIPYGNYTDTGEVMANVRFGKRQTKATLDGMLEKLIAHLPKRRGKPVEGWQETIAAMGKTIIACRSLALARHVNEYFKRRGVRSGLSTHEDDVGSAEVERFKEDAAMPLLIVVRRAVLGFDFPGLVNMIDMTGSVNIDRVFQMFARVVRPLPGARKLFVKMAPKGKAEDYVHKVTRAAIALGHRSFYETFNGKNLDGLVIPVDRPAGEQESASVGSARSPGKRQPKIDAGFLAVDFLEAVDSIDAEFSPYARTTLGKARAAFMGRVLPGLYATCTFPGCGRPHVTNGLCSGHDGQRRTGRHLTELRYRLAPGAVCSFPGCGKPNYGFGLCSGHNQQRRIGKTLVPLKQTATEKCQFPGCGRNYHAHRLCASHWRQEKKGMALTPLKDGLEKDKSCSFPECRNKRKWAGMCAAHAAQRQQGKPLSPIIRLQRPATCTHHGCDEVHYAHGICKSHYDRQRARAPRVETQ